MSERETYSDVVDPNQVRVVDSNGVSTPNILGVDIRDGDILDNDILCATDDPQPLALDDAGAALADQGFVRVDGDAKHAGLVVADAGLGRVGLVVVAPPVLVDGQLALGAGAPGGAASAARCAFGAAEVEAI